MAHWRPLLGSAIVDSKGERNDLVTRADGEIEGLVRGFLLRLRPGDRIVGEEGAAALEVSDHPAAEALASSLSPLTRARLAAAAPGPLEWHVDPIDGTANFVRGIEHHCFSIGAARAGGGGGSGSGGNPADAHWEAGLVAAPELGSVWFARAGAGAWKARGPRGLPGGWVRWDPAASRLRARDRGQGGRIVATGFGYAPERRELQLREFAAIMAGYDDARRMGSAALDLCQVAEGRVSAYYERGLGVYDWAAGALIAQEAGAAVRRPRSRSDMLIAAGAREDVGAAAQLAAIAGAAESLQ
ncbi:inositol-phosphate phosphatase [Brevibacterium sp. 5221]|uniref:inositol-phosphate phosphatase n=1 Tax=Brevibacterium rongguiense TaxID=2695267 RepID=A0A6N9H4B6_9MICO|nr:MULTISPECIES: inositol monophosphatase family protein [Brevibacterium]MYM18860.1 inositol-phosphate phosphatase [Brevibacterium rongguiense]WAL39375.1 inositol-phosphate phosphatase [Brevibacterium sp. BRM-1]